MRDTRTTRTLLLACAWLALTTAGARAASPVTVTNVWSNPASTGGSVQVFATIANDGDDADRLIGASSPSAASAELHDATKGAAVVPALVIPAHGSVTLALAGDYVTFTGLKSDVVAGGLFFARLHFERAGWMVAIVHVKGPSPL